MEIARHAAVAGARKRDDRAVPTRRDEGPFATAVDGHRASLAAPREGGRWTSRRLRVPLAPPRRGNAKAVDGRREGHAHPSRLRGETTRGTSMGIAWGTGTLRMVTGVTTRDHRRGIAQATARRRAGTRFSTPKPSRDGAKGCRGVAWCPVSVRGITRVLARGQPMGIARGRDCPPLTRVFPPPNMPSAAPAPASPRAATATSRNARADAPRAPRPPRAARRSPARSGRADRHRRRRAPRAAPRPPRGRDGDARGAARAVRRTGRRA